MKILLINSSYPPNFIGGAERVVQTLVEALLRSGHEVTVITGQPSGDATVRNMDGANVHYLPIRNVYRSIGGGNRRMLQRAVWHLIDTYNWGMARAVGKILDDVRPDVINTHNIVGLSVAVLAAAESRGIPLVHTLHDQYLLCPRSTMFKRGRNCDRRCLDCSLYARPRRSIAAGVDVVVGVSRFILERHLQFGYFKSTQRRVVYNGLATSYGESVDRERASGSVRFGFLGQVRETKGLHQLIDAFVAEGDAKNELWVAGHGDAEYESMLRARTEGRTDIKWLGFVDPALLFQSIDILVVPSLWQDTAPLVVLEAAARGIPVLGANRGGIPEFITAETGWIYDPDKANDLRRALRVCRSSVARFQTMSLSSRKLAERFTVAAFLEGYISAYSAAIERHAPVTV